VLANGAEMCLNIGRFIIVDANRQLTPNASVKTIQIAIATRCSTPIAAVLITGSNDRLASKFPTETAAPFLAVGVIIGGWKSGSFGCKLPRANQTVEFRPIDGKSPIALILLPAQVLACPPSGVPISPETRQLRVLIVVFQRRHSGTFGLHLGLSTEHSFGLAVAVNELMDLSNFSEGRNLAPRN
jgi:hypothetical protein